MRLRTYSILLSMVAIQFAAFLIIILLAPGPTSLNSAALPTHEISAVQIGAHSTANDCWYSAGGSVYDLTSLAGNAKPELPKLCGTIGTTGDKLAVPAEQLSRHYIGVLSP